MSLHPAVSNPSGARITALLPPRCGGGREHAKIKRCRPSGPGERPVPAPVRAPAYLLVERGRTDELRERAKAGDPDAAERLVMWLLERDRGTDLRAHVSSGDVYVSDRIILALRHKGVPEAGRPRRQEHPDQVGYASAEPLVKEMERRQRWVAEHLADLESPPDRLEIVRASPDEAAAMVDRTIDAGDIDRALVLLRVSAAGGVPGQPNGRRHSGGTARTIRSCARSTY